MKLIVEKIAGAVFAYVESEKQYKICKGQRTGKEITLKELGDDCDLHNYPDDCHLVVDILTKRVKK